MLIPISSFSEEIDSFSNITDVTTSSSTSSETETNENLVSYKLNIVHGQITKVMVYKAEIEKEGISKIQLSAEEQILNSIPIFMSYVDQNSILVIGINYTAPFTNEVYEQSIKSLIGEDLPIKVGKGFLTRHDCPSRTSDCDPEWGGIKIQSGSTLSTLTIPATNIDGKEGFIMSSHAIGGTGTGQTIGQATSSRIVGTVITNPSLVNRTSDSAFVELDQGISGEELIFNLPQAYNVIGTKTSSDTPIGTNVRFMGLTSGEREGEIIDKGLTVTDAFGVLHDQVAVDYIAFSGDSGAPVFSTGSNDVYFYGIHVGDLCFGVPDFSPATDCVLLGGTLFTVYSPWEGIKNELSVELCVSPATGDWIITVDCTIDSNILAPENVIVDNNSILTIPNGKTLDIDFVNKHLLIKSGSSVIIKHGGVIT